jgi:hypothetical protein
MVKLIRQGNPFSLAVMPVGIQIVLKWPRPFSA